MHSPVEPFLKWAGGKRWLAPLIAYLLAPGTARYLEPFLGGAAAFFALQPKNAVLSDINSELIQAYTAVRDSTEGLIGALSKIDVSRAVFLSMRSSHPTSTLRRAIRIMYLNRTAFNGLYRVNQKGDFNVPFGCKPETKPCDPIKIRNCSKPLTNSKLMAMDFRDALRQARGTDRIYLDPPYTVTHNSNCFRYYNERLFSWADQTELSTQAHSLVQRGARIVISNANHDDIRHLYSASLFRAFSIRRVTNMAASTSRRGTCTELLLISRTTLERLPRIHTLLAHFPHLSIQPVRLLGRAPA